MLCLCRSQTSEDGISHRRYTSYSQLRVPASARGAPHNKLHREDDKGVRHAIRETAVFVKATNIDGNETE